MGKLQHVSVYLCLLFLSIAVVGCSNQTSSAQSVTAKTTPIVAPTVTSVTSTVPAVTPTPTSPTPSTQPTTTQSSGGVSDQNQAGKLLPFQGDLFTLTYPEYMGEQNVSIPGWPAGNHRFVYPMAPHSWLDVYEHNGDQDTGEMAAHTLSLTNAEKLQAGTNGKSITFTSAAGLHWQGWDTTITLSQPPVGFSGRYHIRILISQVPSAGAYQKIVIGILAPESSFTTNYQTAFLPIIQSLTLK